MLRSSYMKWYGITTECLVKYILIVNKIEWLRKVVAVVDFDALNNFTILGDPDVWVTGACRHNTRVPQNVGWFTNKLPVLLADAPTSSMVILWILPSV